MDDIWDGECSDQEEFAQLSLRYVGVEGKRRARVVGGDQPKPSVTEEDIRDQPPLLGGEDVIADEVGDKPELGEPQPKSPVIGREGRDQPQPQTGEEEDDLVVVGDQSQAEGGGEPAAKRKSMESEYPADDGKVRDQSIPKTGEEEDGLLVGGDQSKPTQTGGDSKVDIDWDDELDFEVDTAQYVGVTGRRDKKLMGDQPVVVQTSPKLNKDDWKLNVKEDDLKKKDPPVNNQEDPSPKTWSGHPDKLTPGSQEVVDEGMDDSNIPRSSLLDDTCVPRNIEGQTALTTSVLRLSLSHHGASFVDGDGVGTQEIVVGAKREENDCLLDTSTQRKDGEDQAPVSSMEPSMLRNSVTSPVAPSSGKKNVDHTGKAKTIHYTNLECPGVVDDPRGYQLVIPEEDDPQTHHEDPDTDCPPIPVSDQHPTTPSRTQPTPGGRCTHSKGGVCTIHGPGAKERWRPKGPKKIIVDKNGKKRTTYDKEYFWVCDLTPKGGKKLTQTSLKMWRTPARRQDDPGREESLILSSPDRNNFVPKNFDVQTPSVGTENALCMSNTTGLELMLKKDTE